MAFDYFADARFRARRPAREVPASVVASEWDPAPLGRLGRLLWADIERYREFVAIARTEPPVAPADEASGHVRRVRITYLRFR
jgi:hypothetical protein